MFVPARWGYGFVLLLALVAFPRHGAAQLCQGDCNGDVTVLINELVIGVNMALTGEGDCDAFDRNGNGIVDDGSELFGNTRVLASGKNAENGYEVLAELDEDKNGVVDARDPLFAKLLLWGDADRDGVCTPKELTPLSSSRIKSLGVIYDESRKTDAQGNRFRFVALDGSSIDVFPVWDLPDSKKSDKP